VHLKDQLIEAIANAAQNKNCWRRTKSQTTILSNMSHEIRTPMNAIIDLQMCCLNQN
jgi:signal transduction histidine kinase